MKTIDVDVAIIGGGSAGLSCAIELFDRGQKSIIILEKDNVLGGILNQCIHTGFGLEVFKEELSGPEYAERFIKMVEERKIPYRLNTTVIKIGENKEVICSSEDGLTTYRCKAIVFTIGCFERSAGAIQMNGYRPKGVYTAGMAQRYLNIDGFLVGKKVFILGSGDIGLIMARRMTLEGAKVLGVAEIMPYSNGLKRNIVQCLDDFNIPLYLSTTVKSVLGRENVTGVELVKVDENLNYIEGSEFIVPCDTLLLSVGLIPSIDLLKKIGCECTNSTKSAEVCEYNQSTIDGIFLAGNVLHVHDLVDYVTEEGKIAGIGVDKYLRGKLIKREEGTLIKTIPNAGINYIVPHSIIKENVEAQLTLKFRVKKPMQNVYIVLKSGDKVLKKMYKVGILPSEMERMVIDKKILSEIDTSISLEVEEKQ